MMADPTPHERLRLDGWIVSRARCRLCNYRCISIHPHNTDPDTLECERCHHRTMEVVDWDEP